MGPGLGGLQSRKLFQNGLLGNRTDAERFVGQPAVGREQASRNDLVCRIVPKDTPIAINTLFGQPGFWFVSLKVFSAAVVTQTSGTLACPKYQNIWPSMEMFDTAQGSRTCVSVHVPDFTACAEYHKTAGFTRSG